MGLFDDINQFLEERLDEFLRNNPHLELQAIEEQLKEQERDAKKLIAELELETKRLQDEILAIANEIQLWHSRVGKAQAAHRPDLATAAQEREAALLRQGNQVWGQMEGIKQRVAQTQELLQQVQRKRKEIQAQSRQAKATANRNNSYTVGWDRGATSTSYNRAADPLEAEFQKWEIDEELEQIKRKMKS